MAAIEWFYAQQGRQSGPVPPAELKRLADEGKLKPDDLVWREGMPEWAPASNVRGLFEGRDAAALTEMSPGVPNWSPAPPRHPDTAHRPAGPVEAALPAPPRHPVAGLLEFAKARFPAALVDATAALLAQCGHYAAGAVVLLLLTLGILLGVKTQSLMPIALALGAAVMLVVLQYAAGHLLELLARLNRTTTGTLASSVFPHTLALLAMASGVASLIWATLAGLETGTPLLILSGLATFVVCAQATFVCLNVEALNLRVAPDVSVGEEALGLVVFVLKLALRLVPVLYGVGLIMAGLELLYAASLLVRGPGELVVAHGIVLEAGSRATFAAALPLMAYVGFLLCHLPVDLIRAIIARRAEPKYEPTIHDSP